jgi:serine phosphatase RsbU (regulator of sigma subunit)
MRAAAAIALCRHTLATAALDLSCDTGQVLDILHRAIRQRGPANCTVNALFGDIFCQPARLRLKVATAGHAAALVLRADGSTSTVGATSNPLGASSRTGCPELDVWIQGDETVICYAAPADTAPAVARYVADISASRTAMPLQELVDALGRRLVDRNGSTAHEHVALLAVRPS